MTNVDVLFFRFFRFYSSSKPIKVKDSDSESESSESDQTSSSSSSSSEEEDKRLNVRPIFFFYCNFVKLYEWYFYEQHKENLFKSQLMTFLCSPSKPKKSPVRKSRKRRHKYITELAHMHHVLTGKLLFHVSTGLKADHILHYFHYFYVLQK